MGNNYLRGRRGRDTYGFLEGISLVQAASSASLGLPQAHLLSYSACRFSIPHMNDTKNMLCVVHLFCCHLTQIHAQVNGSGCSLVRAHAPVLLQRPSPPSPINRVESRRLDTEVAGISPLHSSVGVKTSFLVEIRDATRSSSSRVPGGFTRTGTTRHRARVRPKTRRAFRAGYPGTRVPV